MASNKENDMTADEQTQENIEGTVQNEDKQPPKNSKRPKDNKEEIFIPRAVDGEERSLFVSVNGVNYLLPKGKTSKVPPEVAYEVRRSMAAQAAWDDKAEALADKQTK